MRRSRRILSLFLILVMSGLLCGNAYAAAGVGHAIFRELGLLGAGRFGHTGVVTNLSGGEPSRIVHATQDANGITAVDFDGFMDADNNNYEYYGTYYKPSTASHLLSAIVVYANDLDLYNIEYTFYVQMNHNDVYSSTLIYPDEISAMRCDGVVEYCYELAGIRLLGPDSAWNISNRSHYPIHRSISASPADQMDVLTQSSS